MHETSTNGSQRQSTTRSLEQIINLSREGCWGNAPSYQLRLLICVSLTSVSVLSCVRGVCRRWETDLGGWGNPREINTYVVIHHLQWMKNVAVNYWSLLSQLMYVNTVLQQSQGSPHTSTKCVTICLHQKFTARCGDLIESQLKINLIKPRLSVCRHRYKFGPHFSAPYSNIVTSDGSVLRRARTLHRLPKCSLRHAEQLFDCFVKIWIAWAFFHYTDNCGDQNEA